MISSNSHPIKRPYSSTNSNASFATPYATLDLAKPTGSGVRPSSVHAQSITGKWLLVVIIHINILEYLYSDLTDIPNQSII